MRETIFYVVFAVSLFIILTNLVETFSDNQENLEAVSPLITIANLAQGLTNGTPIPSNLQVGTTAAPANLSVVGSTTLGNIAIGGSGTGGLTKIASWSANNPTIFNNTDGTNIIKGNTSFDYNVVSINGNIQANGQVNSVTLGAGNIQIGNWAGRPAIWANDTANSLTIHNDGNKTVQIGASGTYPGNLVVTGNTTINAGISATGGDPFFFTGSHVLFIKKAIKFNI